MNYVSAYCMCLTAYVSLICRTHEIIGSLFITLNVILQIHQNTTVRGPKLCDVC